MLKDKVNKNLQDLDDQIKELRVEKKFNWLNMKLFVNAAKYRNYMFWFW
jgi:hypothetical protein